MRSLATMIGVGAIAALAGALGFAGAAAAQDYPSRPVRVVIPFAPGAGTDLLGRLVAGELTQRRRTTRNNRSGWSCRSRPAAAPT